MTDDHNISVNIIFGIRMVVIDMNLNSLQPNDFRKLADSGFLSCIHKNKLGPFYERCNVGVAYIPKTEFFDIQPSTKIFEYLFAGMPVIATATLENKRVIMNDNGILIEDNPESFYEGLKRLYNKRHFFDSKIIKKTCGQYSWNRIVKKNLRPYLENLYKF